MATPLADPQRPGSTTVDAGDFGAWLAQTRSALRGTGGARVPCGDCTGCCTSGYSVQVRPDEHAARAAIPAMLLVDSGDFAPGQSTLPPQPDGRCPMLDGMRCAIYADRPQTCRDYDCRVFAAAGLEPGGADKAAINRRVRAWRFAYAGEPERRAHEAVRSAARFLQERRACIDELGVRVPRSTMGLAVMALKTHAAFLRPAARAADDRELAGAMIALLREFDAPGAEPQGRPA
jgi:Fe-S-cluster containining protein